MRTGGSCRRTSIGDGRVGFGSVCALTWCVGVCPCVGIAEESAGGSSNGGSLCMS